MSRISNKLRQVPTPKQSITKEAKSTKVGQAKQVWDLITSGRKSGHLDLFTDSISGQAYVTAKIGDTLSETDELNSLVLDKWIRYRYLIETGTPISNGLVADTIATVRAVITQENHKRPVFKRVGYTESNGEMKVYYDLCNPKGEVVEITKDGYEVTTYTSVRFKRSSEMLEQVRPLEGGSIEDLWRFIPIKSESDRIKYLGWLLVGFKPKPGHLGLQINGCQGSGKSTTMEGSARIIDPNKTPRLRKPADTRNAAVSFISKHLASLDNVTFIDDEMSDLSCNQLTGGSVAERMMRTNGGIWSARLGGPLIINGIPDLIRRPDLASRFLSITLPKMDQVRPEEEYWKEFDQELPKILGAIFTLISSILRNRPNIKIEKPPRMADAVLWVSAAEDGLGWKPGTFLKVYNEASRTSSSNLLEGNVVSDALVGLMKDKNRWIGTASEMMGEMSIHAAYSSLDKLPDSAAKLRNSLRRLAIDLPAIGLEVEMSDGPSRKLPDGTDAPRDKDGNCRSERWIMVNKIETKEDSDDE